MSIELYPEFNQVFTDETLKGIFYPLCSLTLEEFSNKKFHFISSNGIWMDKNYKTENNSSNFTLFNFKDNKYNFKGDIRLYKGHKNIKNIFEKLQQDFDKNGETYLNAKTKTDKYIKKQKKTLKIETNTDFDLDYYLQTFYEFSINKLNYELNKAFGDFNHIIENWKKSDKSSIIYKIKNDNSTGFADIEINKDYMFPDTIKLEHFTKIGFIIGHEFFSEGNNTYVLFDEKKSKIVCINHY